MIKRLRFMLPVLLVAALLLQCLPLRAEAQDTASLFEDGFSAGIGRWDLFGSTAWSTQGSGTAAMLSGTTTATSPQRIVTKASALPYGTANYSLTFKARGDRFRTMFRYTSGTSYYFLEFKNTHLVELWKYPNASANVQVGAAVDIATALPGFNLTAWHQYELTVNGSAYTLSIDGTAVTTFNDASLVAGGIGFSLKSVGPAVMMDVDDVRVNAIAGPSNFAIVHTPASAVTYNANLPVSFTLTDAGSAASAVIHYAYGATDAPVLTVQAQGAGNDAYAGTIPGTNRAHLIRYYITAADGAGGTARYPASGEILVAIGEMLPYSNHFEGTAPNAVPSGWTAGGSAKVIQLPDGNKVFNLNGSGSAKLNLPMYQNADNFTVKFKVKYERTSTALQNTWRFRYRATDDANNNAMEWATHNSKYFLMRKTTLGGNYYIANYVQSLLGDWHDYELRVSGITHKLFIDGTETASGDDSDPLALKKGYFQWNVVGGINLMIDDFEIDPIPLPYIVDLQPSGNYAGIYTQEETPGLALSLDAGAAAHEIGIAYTVRRADGDRAVVAAGSKTYALGEYERTSDALAFAPALGGIGTYEVSAAFAIDGSPAPALSKTMRLAVVNRAAPVSEPDLDNESKFGLNTHYALNWKDDIIDGARKLGARAHRSGISWEAIDKNVKDASGQAVYNYADSDALLNKLFTYGFNQITGLDIDTNAAYQSGIANTTPALKAMGDFVYDAVSRYKGRIRQWEMPNEPEIFSKPYIPEEFVQLQKIAYLNMKKADPDALLLAGDHTSSVLSVLPEELALGSYDYADAYSFHPYVYNSMPDGNLQNMLNGVKDMVNDYGGWKDYYLTEGGWPTANAGYPSVSEETQRDYIVRAFLNYMAEDQVKAYEYYNYKNDGTDDRYYDIFWGITDNDGRPKLAYAAVNELMTTLDHAQYLGTWDTGNPDVTVQLFLNDGVPVAVAWKKVDAKDDPAAHPPTSVVTLPFPAAGATVKDINGAGIPAVAAANGDLRLTVSGAPVYVTGASPGFVHEAAEQLLSKKEQDASAKLQALRTAANRTVVDGDLAALGGISASLAAAVGGSQAAADLEQAIKDIYVLMADIAGQIGDGSLERAPGYVQLEALYNLAESASVSLVYELGGIGANSIDYGSAAQAATAAFADKQGAYSVMPVASSAVLRMNRYGRLAESLHDRGSYAESYAYNLLAREFAGAAEAMVASEQPKFIGVMANVVPTQANGEAGHANTFTLSLVNDTDVPQQVTVQLGLPDGWASSQTAPASADYTIPANGSLDEPYPVVVPEDAAKGRYEIAFDVSYGGALFETKRAQLTVEDGIGAKLLPVKRTIEELDTLTVELEGTSSFAKTGEVTITGPDGIELQPVATNAFAALQKGGKVQLRFLWTDHQPVPFNEYDVDLRIEDTTTGKTIFHDAVMPVEFNLVQRTDGVTIDGDLADWQDAFPFHLRSKTQNASGFHDPANLEATAYAKWAANGLYVAVAVRDDIHKQSENAANMWKNDSVQVSLDPLNNREAPYGPDDVEWGFALADDGTRLVQIFSSSAPNPNGDVSGQTPFAAVRDDAAGMTYYEFQIPSAYVHDLAPADGGVIGLNVAVNDADLQNGRDDFIQWTNGTADAKNTALYDSFAFIDYDPPAMPAEVTLQPGALLLRPGQEQALTALVAPDDAADKTVTWTAADSEVATVSGGGLVRASGEGATTVTATTKDGGRQASATITVDGTVPVVRIAGPATLSRLASGMLSVDAQDARSGIAATSLQLDGQPIAGPFAIQPLSLAAGVHTLTAEAADAAGNRSTLSSTLTITFGIDELDDMLQYGYAQGWITEKGTLQSLLAKAQKIQKDAAKGDKGDKDMDKDKDKDKDGKDKNDPNDIDKNKGDKDSNKDDKDKDKKTDFKPLLDEIKAQSGKKITAAFAVSLQQDIDYLRQQ